MEPSTVHVVHCIDTEGPLKEKIHATFERLVKFNCISIENSR